MWFEFYYMENEKFKRWVASLYEDYNIHLSTKPTFEDLVKDCIQLKGNSIAEYLFQALKQGWIANNYLDENYNKVFEKYFSDNRHYYYTEMEQYLLDENEVGFSTYFDQTNREEVENSNKEMMLSIGAIEFTDWRNQCIKDAFENQEEIEACVFDIEDNNATAFIILPKEFQLPQNEYMEDYYIKADIPVKEFFNNSKSHFSKEDYKEFEFKNIRAKIKSINDGYITLTRIDNGK